MTTITPRVLDELRRFDTPTVCNLIELFEVRPRNVGYMDGRIRAGFPDMPPMVGFASTATFRSDAPPSGRDVYSSTPHQAEAFEELSGPPVVVFQDLDNPSVSATFGEVMCTTYQTYGAVGLITSGAGRDADQVRALNFPVFTDGWICAHGYSHVLQVHVPVHVGGITIQPDDLIHGDLNGVTTIPREIAAELVDVGDEFVAAERYILDALGEHPSPAELGDVVSEARSRMDKLSKQVSRAR